MLPLSIPLKITRNNQAFDPVAFHPQAYPQALNPLSQSMSLPGSGETATARAGTPGPPEKLYLVDPGLVDHDLPCNVTRSPRQGDPSVRNGDDHYSTPVPLVFAPQQSAIADFLRDCPMELLYFHYFVNHTARSLMVHDCSDNPFRTILPQSMLYESWFILLAAYSLTRILISRTLYRHSLFLLLSILFPLLLFNYSTYFLSYYG